MTCRVRLVLAIHNHQPVGNFDGVFEESFRDSYQPFLNVLEDYPELPISLHISGSLLEWLIAHHPEYVDQVRVLAERGQIEMLGGPFYEPILACIPRRDRIGQMIAYSRFLEQTFGNPIRGMWVPERVWEQSFASDIASAGIAYTILDDFHFRSGGLNEDELYGYYLTEDEGKTVSVFPGSERLRYTIPFQDPGATIAYLDDIGNRHPNAVVVFGDDGEKFGTWPGTRKHVYQDGWLRRFFDALRDNSDWLRVATLAEAIDRVPPLGRFYIPDCSYREMTEWALPTPRQHEYAAIKETFSHAPEWPLLQSFMRGGFWRNFRVKYSEANEMYSRMLLVSEKLQQTAESDLGQEQPHAISKARTELYRAQCNCSYWHGAFGGLYLPHLRNAVYHNLIAADSTLESVRHGGKPWVEIEASDFDKDGRKEVRLAGDRLAAFLAPSRGGHLYELDIRAARHNLLATLNRRPEVYHERVLQAAAHQHDNHNDVASIHDMVKFKQPDLDKKIAYDKWPRKSLVDHFLRPGVTLEQYRKGEGGIGDFTFGVYESVLRRSDQRVEVRMKRSGVVGEHPATVVKTVALDQTHGAHLEITYELEQMTPGTAAHFAVEFNFAGMAAGADDRYFYDPAGEQIGQLQTVHSLSGMDRIGLVDEWLGLDASIESTVPADIWTFPIETISQSEGGFELVHQSCAVIPHWEFEVPQDGRWTVKLTLALDTSAAQARQLREATAAS